MVFTNLGAGIKEKRFLYKVSIFLSLLKREEYIKAHCYNLYDFFSL